MQDSFKSDLTGKEYSIMERIPASTIRKSIFDLILKDKSDFNQNSCISISELNLYRERFIANTLVQEVDDLADLRENVLHAIKDETSLTDQIEKDDSTLLSPGQRLADLVASFGGSWTFILTFFGFIAIWIVINIFWFKNQQFDPYPFILLNLILSCIASLQAPIIMMSQNRQEEKDRERSKKDYMINLKSELEIRMLHEKLDHLILHQQRELIEIQKLQIEMMNDIMNKIKS
ncbi:MAG: DUF1003 domain-containing protein [Saprospiraceae bacterium]|nr:DUF1003 domain-containing protein [Saprospiraceae bacterium]